MTSSKKTRKVIVRQFTCLDWAGQSTGRVFRVIYSMNILSFVEPK